jgi:hypothetical protein
MLIVRIAQQIFNLLRNPNHHHHHHHHSTQNSFSAVSTSIVPAEKMEDMDQYQLKQLLQDVEETNLPRDEVNLLIICKNDERLYGEKGSDMRRTVQFKFGYMKKWSIHKYVALLDSLEVSPSSVTQAIFRDTPPVDEEEPVPESSDYTRRKRILILRGLIRRTRRLTLQMSLHASLV